MAEKNYRDEMKMFLLRCQHCGEEGRLDLNLEEMPTEQAKAFIERHIEKCEESFREKPRWGVSIP